jgi:LPS export ABC transporter protein LptC
MPRGRPQPWRLLVAAAWPLAACQKIEGPPVGAQPNALADSADQVLFKAQFTITDRGVRRADVEGDTAYFFHDNTRMVLRPMRTKFYASTGALDGIAQAREGTYDTRLALLEGRGDVVVNTLDGKRLETPYLKYDQRIDQISSDSAFFMSEPGRDVRGIGFTSDAGLTTFRVTKLLSAKAGTVGIPK